MQLCDIMASSYPAFTPRKYYLGYEYDALIFLSPTFPSYTSISCLAQNKNSFNKDYEDSNEIS